MLIEKMKIILSSGSDEECAICLDSLTFPVITHCAHVFCKPCICQVIHSEQVSLLFSMDSVFDGVIYLSLV
jgi:SWI/SNF-related matrix-associated actin-dependent regulator of chromatin subfamily A3